MRAGMNRGLLAAMASVAGLGARNSDQRVANQVRFTKGDLDALFAPRVMGAGSEGSRWKVPPNPARIPGNHHNPPPREPGARECARRLGSRPGALAAAIGRRKFGTRKMQAMAAAGQRRANA